MNAMKTSQTETDHFPQKRGYRFGLSCFIILLVLPLLLYYGYCWGLWGRHSLLLQYLFQCNCPAASQESRYPESVDVIVPACRNGSSNLSPDGRLLAVYEKDSEITSPYLLDLQTGKKIPLPLPEKIGVSFLTDNLLYFSLSYEKNYILDHRSGDQYPIQRFLLSRPDAYVGGDVNTTLLVEVLRQAKYVVFRDQDDSIVALDPDFPTSTENNILIDPFDIPGKNFNRTEQFLRENNIVYQTILAAYHDEVVSPDGRFVARRDGIYLVKTGQKIVAGVPHLWVRGWTNNRRVLYSANYNPCLWDFWIPMIDDGPSCSTYVSQPVIALKVPEEYLLSASP